MSDKPENGLKQELDRRKRINRIKSIIVSFVGIWMLASVILCATLFVKVIHLENNLNKVLQNMPQVEQVENEETKNSPDADTGKNVEYGKQDQTGQDDANKKKADDGEKLKVYLTFDDGPSTNTQQILDILKQYNVKATFFVIGKTDDLSKEMYKKNEKIYIENLEKVLAKPFLFWYHKYSVIYDSMSAFEQDFNQIHDYLKEVTGVDCKYYRFPGGSSNQVSNSDMREFIRYLNDRGITYYDWNVSSGDATSQAYTADELIQNVMGDVTKYKTSVVLMHDSAVKPATVEALPALIEQLQGIGAEILPIDENTATVHHVSIDGEQGQ